MQDHSAGGDPLGGQATSAPSVLAGQGEFDPGEHTIAEVQAYVNEHPDELDAIYAAEQTGKARSTLLDWLAAQGAS